MPQLYVHHPLELHRQQIRLLSFQPRDKASLDDIVCKLQIYDIDTAPPYVALSYTWGNPTPVHRIYIDQNYLEVGGNLYSFFRAFCRSKKAASICPTSYLWIDQISINQGNPLERNHQVNMMSEIYSRATSTLVWLNDDAHIYDEPRPWGAMTIIRYLQEGLSNDRSILHRLLSKQTITEWLHEFYGHRYWRRLWIIQEIRLARRTQIFSEGDLWLEWTQLASAKDLLGDSMFYYASTASAAVGLLSLAHIDGGWGSDAARMHSLMDLLVFCSDANCMEPRDAVYGLMGITNPNDRLSVDYSKPVQELLLDVLISILRSGEGISKVTLSLLGVRLALSRSQHAAWDRMLAALVARFDVEERGRNRVPLIDFGFGQRSQAHTPEHWIYARSSLPLESKDDGCWWYAYENEVHACPCIIESDWDPEQHGPTANEFGDLRYLPLAGPKKRSGIIQSLHRRKWDLVMQLLRWKAKMRAFTQKTTSFPIVRKAPHRSSTSAATVTSSPAPSLH